MLANQKGVDMTHKLLHSVLSGLDPNQAIYHNIKTCSLIDEISNIAISLALTIGRQIIWFPVL